MKFPPQAHYGLRQRELDFLQRTLQENPNMDVMDGLATIGIETGYMNEEQLLTLQRDLRINDAP